MLCPVRPRGHPRPSCTAPFIGYPHRVTLDSILIAQYLAQADSVPHLTTLDDLNRNIRSHHRNNKIPPIDPLTPQRDLCLPTRSRRAPLSDSAAPPRLSPFAPKLQLPHSHFPITSPVPEQASIDWCASVLVLGMTNNFQHYQLHISIERSGRSSVILASDTIH